MVSEGGGEARNGTHKPDGAEHFRAGNKWKMVPGKSWKRAPGKSWKTAPGRIWKRLLEDPGNESWKTRLEDPGNEFPGRSWKRGSWKMLVFPIPGTPRNLGFQSLGVSGS